MADNSNGDKLFHGAFILEPPVEEGKMIKNPNAHSDEVGRDCRFENKENVIEVMTADRRQYSRQAHGAYSQFYPSNEHNNGFQPNYEKEMNLQALPPADIVLLSGVLNDCGVMRPQPQPHQIMFPNNGFYRDRGVKDSDRDHERHRERRGEHKNYSRDRDDRSDRKRGDRDRSECDRDQVHEKSEKRNRNEGKRKQLEARDALAVLNEDTNSNITDKRRRL